MTLIRTEQREVAQPAAPVRVGQQIQIANHDVPQAPSGQPTLEEVVRAWHDAGHSQRAIARELNIDRRKIKRILDEAA